LVVGARNSGKTSFIEFLRTSLALPPRKIRPVALHDHAMDAPQVRTSPNFVSHYLETEMDDGERIGLTLWDSEGLDKTIMDLQLQEMSSFLESKFEDTFNEEMKVIRSPGVRDTHIHCVFLVLDPLRLDASIAASQKKLNASNGAFAHGKSYLHPPSPAVAGGLDETLDLQVLKVLEGKTTVVPIISKADTITSAHMAQLKRTVWDSLKKTNIDPLEALGLDDGEGDADDSDSDEPGHTPHHTPQKAPFPKPHDSKRLDERDEDHFLQPNHASPDRVATPLSTTSHLESASSSTSSSGSPARRPANQPHPTDSRQSSSTFPSHGPAPTADADAATPYLPLSIISPDPIVAHEPRVGRVGRKFPWGCADPYNPEHCDFVRLKEAVFKEWRGELREASRELWYENWRTSRLNSSHGKGRAGGPNGVNGQNGHGGHGGHGGHAGHGVQQAGLQQAGLQQAGLQQAGLQQAGLQQASLQKAGLQQAGLQQAGLQQRASPRAPALSPLGSHAVGVAR
jgi:septin family protein